jgi:hypothetical protein
VPTPSEVLADVIGRWVDDPESDVEYAELVEHRWAVRMRQQVRDATTVWWELGQRTLRVEAYVIPAPEVDPAPAFRLCLMRNAGSFRVRYALDSEGSILLRACIPCSEVTPETLDQILAEMYEQIELTFRPLLRLAFPAREKPL